MSSATWLTEQPHNADRSSQTRDHGRHSFAPRPLVWDQFGALAEHVKLGQHSACGTRSGHRSCQTATMRRRSGRTPADPIAAIANVAPVADACLLPLDRTTALPTGSISVRTRRLPRTRHRGQGPHGPHPPPPIIWSEPAPPPSARDPLPGAPAGRPNPA
jgi:hypothetical protein